VGGDSLCCACVCVSLLLLPGRQVLRSAEARVGKSKYPVPKEIGARWPLFTLYRSCDMHSALDVVSGVDGDTTLSHLYDKVCALPTISRSQV